MFKQRKGITPVIAIVLLLLVTVGAVGVVYTQFQNIANQGSTDAKYLENVNVKFTVVKRNTSGATDTMQIVLENSGSDQYNLSQIARLEYSIPGEATIRPESLMPSSDLFGKYNFNETGKSCFNQTTGLQSFAPGEIKTCNTGVEMPSPDSEITIKLVKNAAGQVSTIDTYHCSPSTSQSTTCS